MASNCRDYSEWRASVFTCLTIFINIAIFNDVVLCSYAHKSSGNTVTCPTGCICTGVSVSCEATGLTDVPSPTHLPANVSSLDLSRNPSLGPKLSADSVVLLRQLLTTPSTTVLVELKLRDCELATVDGVFNANYDVTHTSILSPSVRDARDDDVIVIQSSSLQLLDLSGNRLVRLGAGLFRDVASSLLQLDLSDNRITEIDAGTFDHLASLVRLDLRQNHLTKVDAATFTGLGPGLRNLRLDTNRIAHIDPDSFASLERLTYLVLRDNPLGTTSSATRSIHRRRHGQNKTNHQQQQRSSVLRLRFQSPVLSYIDMSECDLSRVPRGLPRRSLRYLQLRRNRISSVSRSDIDDCCPSVAVLVLDDNRLDSDSLADSPFADRVHLRQLWLANNRLRSVPRPTPVGLERLFLDGNAIDRLEADHFPTGSRLQTLSLGSNQLGPELMADALSRLGNLRSLDLSGNNLRAIRAKTFGTNRLLESLTLAKNPLEGGELENGSFDGLGLLETLVMSHVYSPVTSQTDESRKPTQIEPMTFDGFRDGRLRKLDLDGSRGLIQDLLSAESSVLHPLGDVSELSMLDADLETIPDDFASVFHNLVVFRVSSSRWRCDRSLIWFRDFLLSVSASSMLHDDNQQQQQQEPHMEDNADAETVKPVSIASNRCLSPPSVLDRSLSSLADFEFGLEDITNPQRQLMFSSTVSNTRQSAGSTSTRNVQPTASSALAISATVDVDDNGITDRNRLLVADVVIQRWAEVEFGRMLQAGGGEELSAADKGSYSQQNLLNRLSADIFSSSVSSLMTSTTTPHPDAASSVTSSTTTSARSSQNSAFSLLFSAISAANQVSLRSKKSQNVDGSEVTTKPIAVVPSSSSAAMATAMAIVAPLVGGTAVVAAGLLVMIGVACRRHDHSCQRRTGSTMDKQNGGDGHHVTLCVRTSFVGSSPKTAAVSCTETIMLASTTPGSDDVDGGTDCGDQGLIGLIPGRDINHEGPLRVYKWEDF